MHDLISRQAAKLKVARVIWEDGDSCYDFQDKCVDCLDDVPSAQPETDGFCPRFDRVIKTTIDEMKMEQQWIPCSERLPEEPFGCLVTVWDTNPVTMDEFENLLPYFVGWDGEQWNDADGEQCPFEVIAWMPLPDPFKGESETE